MLLNRKLKCDILCCDVARGLWDIHMRADWLIDFVIASELCVILLAPLFLLCITHWLLCCPTDRTDCICTCWFSLLSLPELLQRSSKQFPVTALLSLWQPQPYNGRIDSQSNSTVNTFHSPFLVPPQSDRCDSCCMCWGTLGSAGVHFVFQVHHVHTGL